MLTNDVEIDIRDSGGSFSEIHPAFVDAHVLGGHIVQDEPSGIVVSPEEGSAGQNFVV